MKFCTIASGSSGNCAYAQIGGKHFLIDAGVSGKRIQNALSQINVHNIDGIFITHEHRDHVVGAGILARRLKTNIYATPLTWRFFANHRTLGELDAGQIKVINPGMPLEIDGIKVTAFSIMHDAIQPVGYTFEVNDKKIAVATDLGCATDVVREHLKGAQIILLESNHDPVMLKNGPYVWSLKRRVASNVGHLSNADAGVLLADVAGTELQHVFLAHLSEDNNLPILAYDTVKRVLDSRNVNIQSLIVAERHQPGMLVSCG